MHIDLKIAKLLETVKQFETNEIDIDAYQNGEQVILSIEIDNNLEKSEQIKEKILNKCREELPWFKPKKFKEMGKIYINEIPENYPLSGKRYEYTIE